LVSAERRARLIFDRLPTHRVDLSAQRAPPRMTPDKVKVDSAEEFTV
jgi:hypothetical protein